MKIGDVMSAQVVTLREDTSVEEIARVLTENNISGAPVVDGEGHVKGIVTQKDLLYKDIEPRFPAVVEILGGLIFLKGVRQYNEELKKLVATKAADLMTAKVITVTEDETVERAAELMVENNVNRLPVTRDGRLVGIVSRADIIRYIAGSQE